MTLCVAYIAGIEGTYRLLRQNRCLPTSVDTARIRLEFLESIRNLKMSEVGAGPALIAIIATMDGLSSNCLK
jgi:predicted nicotinamide N-methyase